MFCHTATVDYEIFSQTNKKTQAQSKVFEPVLCQCCCSLCQSFLQIGTDCLKELLGINRGWFHPFHDVDEILCHDAGVEGVEACILEFVAEFNEFGQSVNLAALAQSTTPGKDRSHGVSGCLLAFEVLVVVACHGTVGSLELEFSIGRNENRGHHGQRSESGGDHIGHHVAIIVLAGPDIAALTPYHAGYRVIDECVEILKTKTFEVALVGLIHFVEYFPETGVVLLRYGVFGREPEILSGVYGKLEAAVGE